MELNRVLWGRFVRLLKNDGRGGEAFKIKMCEGRQTSQRQDNINAEHEWLRTDTSCTLTSDEFSSAMHTSKNSTQNLQLVFYLLRYLSPILPDLCHFAQRTSLPWASPRHSYCDRVILLDLEG